MKLLETLTNGGPVMIPIALVSLAIWVVGLDALFRMRSRVQASRALDALGALTNVAPFLGLLGTVGGMVLAFRGLAQWGPGDFRGLSDGIARALISTQAGLLVALSGLILTVFVRQRRDRRHPDAGVRRGGRGRRRRWGHG